MTNYFKDYAPGYPVKESTFRRNSDGTSTQIVKFEGVELNYASLNGATACTADFTIEINIPDSVTDVFQSGGPVRPDLNYYMGLWTGNFDVPEQFQ